MDKAKSDLIERVRDKSRRGIALTPFENQALDRLSPFVDHVTWQTRVARWSSRQLALPDQV